MSREKAKLKQLEETLIESWSWAFQKARIAALARDRTYEAGLVNGMEEAYASILLQVVGEVRMTQLYREALKERIELEPAEEKEEAGDDESDGQGLPADEGGLPVD